MKQLVQTLQVALEKEKAKVKDLKEQVKTPNPTQPQHSHYLSSLTHYNTLHTYKPLKETLAQPQHNLKKSLHYHIVAYCNALNEAFGDRL